jgi:hypothetical protein
MIAPSCSLISHPRTVGCTRRRSLNGFGTMNRDENVSNGYRPGTCIHKSGRRGHRDGPKSLDARIGKPEMWSALSLWRLFPSGFVLTGKPDVIPGEKFALPVTWVRGIKLRLFAFSSVAASHDSFATGLRSGRPIFVLPLLRENKTPGCPIQRVLENDFVVVTGTGTARDFIRLLTVELH